jgi:hypothetical protein
VSAIPGEKQGRAVAVAQDVQDLVRALLDGDRITADAAETDHRGHDRAQGRVPLNGSASADGADG